MQVEVRLPQFGMGMQDGTINQWYKEEGDAVTEGELLAEVEAAKSVEELTSPCDGVLHRILVPAGDSAIVNELLAVIVSDGDPSTAGQAGEAASTGNVEVSSPPVPIGAPASPMITPRARRLARDLGVDLDRVIGTGPQGRVTDDDVRRAAGPANDVAPPIEREAMTGMRAAIAERTRSSLHASAQLTLTTEIDVTELVAHRRQLAEPRPTYTEFLIKATALALREHPRLNATVEGDAIHRHARINVGVATALPDALLVPVVRDADQRSLRQISDEVRRLVGIVLAGEHRFADVTGSTFTITSLGSLGIDAFTPIINPPEVAILGVGRIVDRPVPDGEGLAWRKAMTLSLTIDHRVVDGAPGAEFLQTLARLIQVPGTLGS
jgi:pyruvate dehydrogenase E2 component (dihydrolipoyllysine-residue acetyltransferase)